MSINSFLSTIAANGGMSFSNNFVVLVDGAPVSIPNEDVYGQTIAFMCDEAQLPNINTATGTQNGLYTGLGSIDYPHTRVFTELQLGFMLDANLTVLKYLNEWHSKIFNEGALESDRNGGLTYLPENRVTRLRYSDEYVANILITKTESGPQSTIQRKPITYVLEKAYPYAIDAVPLQFGSSQITKVTAQFKYQRHYTINRDITSIKDSQIPAAGRLVGSREVRPGIIEQEWLLPNGKIIKREVPVSAADALPTPPPPTVPAKAPESSPTTGPQRLEVIPFDPRERSRRLGT